MGFASADGRQSSKLDSAERKTTKPCLSSSLSLFTSGFEIGFRTRSHADDKADVEGDDYLLMPHDYQQRQKCPQGYLSNCSPKPECSGEGVNGP